MEKIEEEIKDMTPKLIGEVYKKFPTEKSAQLATYGLYECQYCGKEFETQVSNVKRGNTKSCGCLRGDAHGLRSNRFYDTWYNMLRRCNNLESINYKNYGGRGITVCDEWLDVTNFIAWAESTHPNTEGMSLDRIDNDKGYSPKNCRWVDRTTQALNRRKMRTNTSGYVGVYSGVIKDGWYAKVGSNNKLINIGSFKTKEEAAQARDNYIIENGLPHKLSGLIKNERKTNGKIYKNSFR